MTRIGRVSRCLVVSAAGVLVACTTAAAPAAAGSGVDTSTAVSVNQYRCLKGNGYTFATVRALQSTGRADPNAAATVANARKAGIPQVDIYLFPHPMGGNAAAQVDLVAARKLGAGDRTVWIDVEGTKYWSHDKAYNQRFFTDMVNRVRSRLSRHVGVYTSKSQWGPIMGDWNGGADLPLWYAHYDNKPDFNDFSAFGGWSRPAVKQYTGTTKVCDVSVDKNFRP